MNPDHCTCGEPVPMGKNCNGLDCLACPYHREKIGVGKETADVRKKTVVYIDKNYMVVTIRLCVFCNEAAIKAVIDPKVQFERQFKMRLHGWPVGLYETIKAVEDGSLWGR